MIFRNEIKKIRLVFTIFFLIALLNPAILYAKMVTQLVPTLTITEEYTDNYFRTQNDKFDEYITTIGLGFSLGFLEKKHNIYLNYNPRYRDYKNLDENDGLDHILSLDGNSTPSKHSNISYGVRYSATATDRNESNQSNIYLNGDFQVSKHTGIYFRQKYARIFDEQVATGVFNESDQNNTSVGGIYDFGKNDSVGFDYEYSFRDYKDPNFNDHTRNKPSAFITYWFTPHLSLDSNLYFSKIDYDTSGLDQDTYSGDILLLKKFSKHFGSYVKYRQMYIDNRNSDTQNTYNPSIGIDWQPTDDSGITLGVGMVFYDFNDFYDDYDSFVEFDIYKVFDFSKRGSFSITGSSGYDEGNEEAINLGFHYYYRAGGVFTYQLARRLSTDITASYTIDEYKQPIEDRTDNTFNFRAGLSWSPLKWLRLSATYEFIDFSTDATLRDDYQENKGYLSISFTPKTPIRFDRPASRKELEEQIFNY